MQLRRLRLIRGGALGRERFAPDVQAELDRAAKYKAEKAELRAQPLRQFNAVLPTRDTARGLIVSMPDVLFGTVKYRLRPLAREGLAKVAFIVSGQTDSSGFRSSAGLAVRDYLVQQGCRQAQPLRRAGE